MTYDEDMSQDGSTLPTVEETVADAMVGVECAMANATRNHEIRCPCGGRPDDWGNILTWLPQTSSALFASANGL